MLLLKRNVNINFLSGRAPVFTLSVAGIIVLIFTGMKHRIVHIFSSIAALAALVLSCTHKPYVAPVQPDGNYPAAVAKILVAKCALSGCHNAASYANAGGLRLDSWDELFNGGNNGAEVVPYSPAYSPLLYYVNTDSSLGIVSAPTMPVSTTIFPQSPLSKDEYQTLSSWISDGAPDKNGNVAFSSNAADRQKIYITQQGCDLMAVVDAEKHVIMRYIPIGVVASQVESPHCTRASSDGRYLYTSFLNGRYVQKIDMLNDMLVSSANVGSVQPNGSWNILYVAPADTALLVSSWTGDGVLAYVDAGPMNVLPAKTFPGLVYPHGITSSAVFDTFYVTAQFGNVVYKMSANGMFFKQISVNGATAATSTDTGTIAPNPHEIMMVPDHSRYFVTCQGTNQVVVMDAHADTIIKRINVGIYPQEMAISTTEPYIFVTCMEDGNPNPGMKGSVYAINYNTYETQAIYGDFYQPHAITVDDRNGFLYVVSTNANPTGPAPHHATACGGRAGWYSIYNLHTLQAFNNKRFQLSVMPYSAATRFRN